MHAHEQHAGWYSHRFDYHCYKTRHEIQPPNCQHMNHGSMTLFSARGQILSTLSPIFSSIPPPRQPPTFLLSHKWASLLYQKHTGKPGGGTKLLSLSQQQLAQELQQQIGFSNKLLSSLRLLPSPPSPRHSLTCPTVVVGFRLSPPAHYPNWFSRLLCEHVRQNVSCFRQTKCLFQGKRQHFGKKKKKKKKKFTFGSFLTDLLMCWNLYLKHRTNNQQSAEKQLPERTGSVVCWRST